MPNVALHSSQVPHRFHRIGPMWMAQCGKTSSETPSLTLRALPFDLVNDKLIAYREIKLKFESNSRVEQDVILARRKPPHQLTGLSVRRGR
ncbi:hypothetical protein LMG28727_07099 [Paraburkholderia kirstenboschensis]|nr:hypothetical protein LMG28727_07099 [Paraburkholderia kirstenboschensis]